MISDLGLPESFFDEEERYGYLITAKMKRVWAVELDLLREFVQVCERNGLRYYLDGGTLLGAVRHKGFIPWDDDVDVNMPREDYNKLLKIASKEFQEPYYLQTTQSEKGFFRTHAQLRNSDTTGFIAIDNMKNVNKGIALDIFILDGVPSGKLAQKWHRFWIVLCKGIMKQAYDKDYFKLSTKGKLRYHMGQLFFKVVPFKAFYNFFEHYVIGAYSNKKTELIGSMAVGWKKNWIWNRSWFDGYVYLPFETLSVRVPLFYTKVLTRQYGASYMSIPKNPPAATHNNMHIDPDKPYKEYYLEKQKYIIREKK